jgi:hypothetical protein
MTFRGAGAQGGSIPPTTFARGRARQGTARLGAAGQGTARLGAARHGLAWLGWARIRGAGAQGGSIPSTTFVRGLARPSRWINRRVI